MTAQCMPHPDDPALRGEQVLVDLARRQHGDYTTTCVTKSIKDWPAPASEIPMLRTDIAALPGCEITKNTRSTTVSVPRIFLTFITTTVHGFGTTRAGLVLPDRGGVTESITHTGSQLIMTERRRVRALCGWSRLRRRGTAAGRPPRQRTGPGAVVGPRRPGGAGRGRRRRARPRDARGDRPGRRARAARGHGAARAVRDRGLPVHRRRRHAARPGDDALDARFVDRAALARAAAGARAARHARRTGRRSRRGDGDTPGG